jgi:hypothetical protein
MTPHQVLSLLTQDQTQELMMACAQYLPIDRIQEALRQGLDEIERRQLAWQLSVEFDTTSSQDVESS